MSLRRILIITLVFVTLLAAATWWTVTRSDFARELILDRLTSLVSGQVDLDKAELDPIGGRVTLQGVRLVPEGSGEGGRKDALQVPEIVLGVSMNPLSGAGELRSVTIDRAELDIDLASDEPFDLDKLIPPEAKGGKGGKVPSVRIRELLVRLHLPSKDDRVLLLQPIDLSLLPDPEKAGRMVVSGSCPNPLGGRIEIHGEAKEDGSDFALTATGSELELASDKIELLGDDVLRAFRKRKLAGKLAPTLWLRYAKADGRLRAGVRGQFRDLQVETPTVPYLFTHLAGRIDVGGEDDGRVLVRVERSGTDLEMSGEVAISGLSRAKQRVRVRAKADGIALDERLMKALRAFGTTRDIVTAFEPRHGRASLDIFVDTGARAPSSASAAGDVVQPRVQADIELEGCDIRYSGFPRADASRSTAFPYPWTDARLLLKLRDEFVEIADLRATGVHGGTITGHGKLDFASEEASLNFDVEDLPCTKALRDALAVTIAEGAKVYDDFQPEGRVKAELRLRKRAGNPLFAWSLGLETQDATIKWSGFPYRVPGLAGRIDIDERAARFDVTGNDSEAQFTARGRIGLGAKGSREVWLSCRSVELDARLREAMSAITPSLGETWDMFSPSGRADVEFLAWQPEGSSELSYDLRADLLRARARFSPFPVALRELEGPVVVHGDGQKTHIEVLGLTGRGLDARLSFEGTLDFDAESRVSADLEVVAKGVKLRRELGQVLADTKLVSPRIWDIAKVSGSTDAVLELRRSLEDDDWRKSLTVDLRQVRSEAAILPDTLTKLSGSVRIDENNAIHIDRVRGHIGEAPLVFEKGKIRQLGEDTIIELEMSADRYPVDDRLANLLSGEVKRAYLARSARGRVSLVGVQLEVRVPGTPPPGADGLGISIEFEGGEFRAHGLSLNMGVQVSDIVGYATLERGYVRPDASEIRGRLGGLGFSALAQNFSDARGPFVATHKRFVLPTGSVRVHGGILRGFSPDEAASDGAATPPVVRYEFDESKHLEVALQAVDLDIAKALAPLKLPRSYRGLLSGRVQLALDIDDPTSLDVNANLGVRDGWLGDAPIFRSIYGLLKQDRRPSFHAALVDVRSRGQSIEINRFLLLSALLRVEGRGRLDYDGYLDMQLEFPNLFPEASPLTILPGIYRAVANALVTFDVAGYVGDLRSGPRFVPLESKPKKPAVEPIGGRRATLRPIFRE